MRGFFDYYCIYTDKGKLPNWGLCKSLPKKLKIKKAWKMVCPCVDDLRKLALEKCPPIYWGRGDYKYTAHDLTPLRETILLFAALLNGEKII